MISQTPALISIPVLIAVAGTLVAIIVWQGIRSFSEARRWRRERAEMLEERKDLLNRLMARDIVEYTGATRALQSPSKDEAETEEETSLREEAFDRIPIN